MRLYIFKKPKTIEELKEKLSYDSTTNVFIKPIKEIKTTYQIPETNEILEDIIDNRQSLPDKYKNNKDYIIVSEKYVQERTILISADSKIKENIYAKNKM